MSRNTVTVSHDAEAVELRSRYACVRMTLQQAEDLGGDLIRAARRARAAAAEGARQKVDALRAERTALDARIAEMEAIA